MAFKYNLLSTRSEITPFKHRDLLDFHCHVCDRVFQRTKNHVIRNLREQAKYITCSRECANKAFDKRIKTKCDQCQSTFLKQRDKFQYGAHSFCSLSCSTTYNNTHKTTGTRRSKLEIYLEEQLRKNHDFEILFNNKTVINSELDIYIPSLKLAFELNGIFHYEPIYGQDKL